MGDSLEVLGDSYVRSKEAIVEVGEKKLRAGMQRTGIIGDNRETFKGKGSKLKIDQLKYFKRVKSGMM